MHLEHDRFMTAGGLGKKKPPRGGIKNSTSESEGGANERMFDTYFDESDITTV
jgi:hypothetical protein